MTDKILPDMLERRVGLALRLNPVAIQTQRRLLDGKCLDCVIGLLRFWKARFNQIDARARQNLWTLRRAAERDHSRPTGVGSNAHDRDLLRHLGLTCPHIMATMKTKTAYSPASGISDRALT